MKKWIRTSIATALIAAGAIGSTAALAWGGHCDGPRGGKSGWSEMAPEQMKAKMAERAERGASDQPTSDQSALKAEVNAVIGELDRLIAEANRG